MRSRSTTLSLLGVAAVLTLAGCGDDDGVGSVAGDPAAFVAARDGVCSAGTDGFVREAGSTINVDFINERSEDATFAVQFDGADEPLVTETVAPDSTERVRVDVDEAGEYVLGCAPDEWAGLRVRVSS